MSVNSDYIGHRIGSDVGYNRFIWKVMRERKGRYFIFHKHFGEKWVYGEELVHLDIKCECDLPNFHGDKHDCKHFRDTYEIQDIRVTVV